MRATAHAALLLLAGATSAPARAAAQPAAQPAAPPPADTLRLEVGAPQVNGRVYAPHAARVRVRVGADDAPLAAEWTNELALGDSAGRPVMRWVTKGTRFLATGDTVRWELRQTYDAVTLAPYGYVSSYSTGAFTRLRIDGRRVRGTRRVAADSAVRDVDVLLDRPGFVAGASDLVPPAVGLRAGAVMTAPVWGPAMTASELRVFSVLDRAPVRVEGAEVLAWRVEERRAADRALVATWWLTEASPYMVYGEVPLPNGRVQRMTEVGIPVGSVPDE
jgi:hypothetical protein